MSLFATPGLGRLAVECAETFQRLSTEGGRLEASAAGLEYASALRSALERLPEGSEAARLLRGYELLLSAAQFLLLDPPSASLRLGLVAWGRWNFDSADARLRSVLSSGGDGAGIHRHPHFWPAVKLLVAFGRLEDAAQLLAYHPSAHSQAFAGMAELLSGCPLASGACNRAAAEEWRSGLDSQRRRGAFAASAELEALAGLLAGDESGLADLAGSGLLAGWHELLLPLGLFGPSEPRRGALGSLATSAQRLLPPSSGGDALDSALVAALDGDGLGLLTILAEKGSDWWLSAHLGDLLWRGGHLETASSILRGHRRDVGQFRDRLLSSYAESLSEVGQWQAGLAYLDGLRQDSETAAGDFLLDQADRTTSRAELQKLLSAARMRSLAATAAELCRRRSEAAMGKGRLEAAMSWAIDSEIPPLVEATAEALLRAVTEATTPLNLHFLLGTGDAKTPTLLFLAEYLRFRRLAESGGEGAGALLMALTTATPPPFFQLQLLDELRRLLLAQEWRPTSAELDGLFVFLARLAQPAVLDRYAKAAGLRVNDAERMLSEANHALITNAATVA